MAKKLDDTDSNIIFTTITAVLIIAISSVFFTLSTASKAKQLQRQVDTQQMFIDNAIAVNLAQQEQIKILVDNTINVNKYIKGQQEKEKCKDGCISFIIPNTSK